MRSVCWMTTVTIATLCGCQKQSMINGISSPPVSMIVPRIPPPRIPRSPLSLEKCINSYEELITLLGNSEVTASAVVLESGVTIRPGDDLQSIVYTAEQQTQSNSLFGSKLSVSWRYPGGNWQLNTSDVWSLGCVFSMAGEPPYTNLIKNGQVLEINTCFFWETDVFTRERIAYVVLD